ncbi:MAG: NifU N-terminal domain-containing protein [Chloroflexi bacterium]|nr:NifU N-terminal domain-containing protein [Chloroflexota bacterium]
MSEYIEIQTEIEDDDLTMAMQTNLRLTDGGRETYHSPEEMEEGSPVAQALAVIVGIDQLTLDGQNMIIVRDADAPWHSIIGDISAALKDFFL